MCPDNSNRESKYSQKEHGGMRISNNYVNYLGFDPETPKGLQVQRRAVLTFIMVCLPLWAIDIFNILFRVTSVTLYGVVAILTSLFFLSRTRDKIQNFFIGSDPNLKEKQILHFLKVKKVCRIVFFISTYLLLETIFLPGIHGAIAMVIGTVCILAYVITSVYAGFCYWPTSWWLMKRHR